MSRALLRGLILSAALGCATGGGASAQQPQDPDSVIALEPLEVRVLRSAIGTRDPYPVSIAAGPELTRGSAGAFLEEALRAVPGVQIQNRFNYAVGERLSVRGFGPRAQFGIRGIRVLVDGVPATLPDGQATLDHLDLSSLGRVEVLRGPNATLYGNAAGGVIHFRTLDPALGGPSLSLRSAAGSNGLLTLQGTATGQAGDVGFRVNATRLEYDGFRRDPVADDGSVYGAATRSVLNGTVSVPTVSGTLRFVVNGLDLDAENPGSLSQALLDIGDRQAYRGSVTSRTGKTIRQGQVGASWDGAIGATKTQFAAWGIRREFENPIPGTIIGVDRNAGGLRALVSGARALSGATLGLGFGAELELQRDDRLNWVNAAGDKGALTLSQLERVRGSGVFTHARLDLDAGVSFITGLRYDRIRFSVEDRFFAGGDPDDSGSRTMDALSPSAGVVVEVRPGIEVFGSVARSFETPTTTELANRPTGAGGFNPDIEPQRGTSWEGGGRARIAGTWSAEATLFRTNLRDGLVPFEVPTDPGRQYFRNAGESHHAGWELSLDGRFAEGASIRVAYTRVLAIFDSFQTESDDYSGKRVPGLAPRRLDALGQFVSGPLFLGLRGLWQDAVPVDDANAFEADSYFLVDLRAGLDDLAIGRVSVSPFAAVANMLDRRYVSSVAVNAFGTRFYEPGPGRTLQVGLGITWRGAPR